MSERLAKELIFSKKGCKNVYQQNNKKKARKNRIPQVNRILKKNWFVARFLGNIRQSNLHDHAQKTCIQKKNPS